MNYQILVLDLDGTLTNSKKEITPPTYEALIDIQKAGKKVVLASGRPARGVIPLAQKLELGKYGSYILAFNGAKIIDCRTGQTIYNRILPTDVYKPLYDIVKKYPELNMLHYFDDYILCSSPANKYAVLESNINHMDIVVEEERFLSRITGPANKFLITGEPEIIENAKKEIKNYFRSYLSVYCSDTFFLEVVPAGVDKAHSLLKLLTNIGLSTEEMICCGDGQNDLTMIETAGLGVAMANAHSQVLEKADYITKSNDEDGVLHVINEFMRKKVL